jgi:lipopolysaccharide transport system ATP-binding protein
LSELAVKIENLSKQYRLGQIGTGTLSHDLNRWFAKVRGKEDPTLKIGQENILAKGKGPKAKGDDYVWALKDINLEIKKGEVLGIIGKNGAGKSTLLKILSRVTGPTTGSIKVNGRIASLLEVGTGFHPELTGKENIYLNGAILGMTKREITSKLDEIVEFAGVAKYLDTPVKRYSSGMYVRLAFAVAAHLESEILVVDEVLAVGDAEFQKKAIGKMQDVAQGEGRTVLFVSHNMATIQSLCKKGYVLNNGLSCFSGVIQSAVETYNNLFSFGNFAKNEENSFVKIENIQIFCKTETNIIHSADEVFFRLIFYLKKDYSKIDVTFHIYNQNNVRALVLSSIYTDNYIPGNIGKHEIIISQKNLNLIPGTYYVSIGILGDRFLSEILHSDFCASFEVSSNPKVINYNVFEGVLLPEISVVSSN